MLNRYIPKPLFETRKPAVWEKLLLERLKSICMEPMSSEYEGKLRYITRFSKDYVKFYFNNRLREVCPDYFGSIFYDAVELIVVDKVVRNRIPVVLGINIRGIHTFKKIPSSFLVRSNLFHEILGFFFFFFGIIILFIAIFILLFLS
jgi:hypothetical protein